MLLDNDQEEGGERTCWKTLKTTVQQLACQYVKHLGLPETDGDSETLFTKADKA